MSEIMRVTRIDFDGMENTPTEYCSEGKYFKSNGKLSAHGVCGEYLSSLTVTPYLGWNGEVYPKFKVESIYIE